MKRFKGVIQAGIYDACMGIIPNPPSKKAGHFWVTDEVIWDYLYGFNAAKEGGEALKEALLVCLAPEEYEDD